MVLQQAPSKATIWGFGEVGQDVLLTARKGEYQARIKKGIVTRQKEGVLM